MIPKGSFQIESGILLGYTDVNEISERQILAPSNLFRIGIGEKIELRVVNQFENIKNAFYTIEGISDLEIGAKVQLLQREGAKTEMALLSHLVLPTGTRGLTNDDLGTVNKLCISHAINDNFGVGYNIGYNYFGIGDGDITYSLALGFAFTERLGLYIEPYGEIVNLETSFASMDAGFTYLIEDNLQFDFSFGTGLDYTMNYVSVGISWNIVKKDI